MRYLIYSEILIRVGRSTTSVGGQDMVFEFENVVIAVEVTMQQTLSRGYGRRTG